MNIIIGIAQGLKYLHTEIDPPFTISELTSSSVYLTDDFSPKVKWDFMINSVTRFYIVKRKKLFLHSNRTTLILKDSDLEGSLSCRSIGLSVHCLHLHRLEVSGLCSQHLVQLVDFECWKTILSRSGKSSGTISNEGAVCILPKDLEGRHLDIQGNTYAFGILLLEIISGRPPYCKKRGCLVDWVQFYFPNIII